MKTLLILRHGKSSWDHPGLPDHERPLKKRGEREAPRMGALLNDEELTPELIISSTAERARRTAALVAGHCGYAGTIRHDDALYHGSVTDYLDLLIDAAEDRERVMIVGHNPGLEAFVTGLTGEQVRLPTAALARISLPIARWCELTLETHGTMDGVWRPKEL